MLTPFSKPVQQGAPQITLIDPKGTKMKNGRTRPKPLQDQENHLWLPQITLPRLAKLETTSHKKKLLELIPWLA